MRILWLLCVLVVVPGCSLFRWAPGVPSTHGQEPVAFADEATLRAFLEESARARGPRRVSRMFISEADGGELQEHIEERTTPRLYSAMAPEVEPARGVLESGGGVWVARERGIARAAWRDGALVAVAPVPPLLGPAAHPFGMTEGLLAVEGGVVGMFFRNECDGFTLARYPWTEGPPAMEGMLRACGKLVSQPWAVRVGSELLAYAVFEGLAPDGVEVTLPTVQTAHGAARPLPALGPVYYPVEREADVLLRTLFRCDAALESCTARTWVSPRSVGDALWVDSGRFVFAFSTPDRSTVHTVPLAGGTPRYVHAPEGAFALSGLSDGRLALLRGELTRHWPDSGKPFSVVTLDAEGRSAAGPTLPAVTPGRPINWTWAVHGDWLVYGPTRTHNLGGAVDPRAFVVPLPGGPAEAQSITSPVDAVRFTGEEAILLGSDSRAMKWVVRRPLARPGPWKEYAYDTRPLGQSQLESPRDTVLLRLGARTLLVVTYPSGQHWLAHHKVRVLELAPDGVTVLGEVLPEEDREKWKGFPDARSGAMVWEGLLLIRLSRELVMVEPDATGLRELSRLML